MASLTYVTFTEINDTQIVIRTVINTTSVTKVIELTGKSVETALAEVAEVNKTNLSTAHSRTLEL